ncbi:hypothetical protein [Bacillus sp. EAC]|uniref:hypothetical protein n=1 Tax=Bacillus sp. EAC TaxID=1978338 RepID=UPI0015C4EBC3|nr:hypothetical protein [Bacillus sp. EAC]
MANFTITNDAISLKFYDETDDPKLARGSNGDNSGVINLCNRLKTYLDNNSHE